MLLFTAAPRRLLNEVAALRPRARTGDGVAMNNLTAAYRALGRWRLAFKWWQRCAWGRDGDAWLEIGYCLQYGLGPFTATAPSTSRRSSRI